MGMSNERIRFIVGIIGNVLSFFLFISPAPTMWRIFKSKTVEDFLPDPYIACVMNCMLWIFYGLPFNHPDSLLVITINGFGLVLELVYLSLFLRYGKQHRTKILGWLAIEVVGLGVIAGIDLGVFHTHERRSFFVGVFCIIFGVCMYASPLTIMKKVIKTKSVEYMPFYLSLTAFLNGCCWTAYALLKFDWFILIANGLGAFSGFMQLVLYALFYRTTPKKSSKTRSSRSSEVQLENV